MTPGAVHLSMAVPAGLPDVRRDARAVVNRLPSGTPDTQNPHPRSPSRVSWTPRETRLVASAMHDLFIAGQGGKCWLEWIDRAQQEVLPPHRHRPLKANPGLIVPFLAALKPRATRHIPVSMVRPLPRCMTIVQPDGYIPSRERGTAKPMPAKENITIEIQVIAAEEELRTRIRVYDNLCRTGRMNPVTADRKVAEMRAIVDTLRSLAARDGAQPDLPAVNPTPA
jgi:hypothetical protein